MKSKEINDWSWRDSGNHGVWIKSLNWISAKTGRATRPFDADQLIRKARKQVGLTDLGSEEYYEALKRLCEAYSHDPNLTEFGQQLGRGLIVDCLVNRLKIVEWIRIHPEVEQQKIQAPWFITGLIRSGTTLSANFFSLDPRVRSPLRWEIDNPIPPATLAGQYSDPRIEQCKKKLHQLDKLAPSMKAIHPQEATLPEECLLMMQMDFRSYMFVGITSLAQEYIDWYLEADKLSTYKLHKQMLQVWQSSIPTERWALKAPNHMHGIDALMKVYPDARVVWNHRDPLVCIPSVASLSLTFLKLSQPDIDPRLAAREFNKHWLSGVQQMMAYDSAQADKQWCHHMYYQDIITDPVSQIKSAYAHFEDEVSSVHEARINAWVQQRPQHSFGKHTYSLEEFGLDADEMREQYSEYMTRYNVPVEFQG